MEDYQSQGNHYQKTTSANSRGGCFSLLFSPIYYILLALAIFLMANGETTQPWDLTAARQISAGDESIVPQQKLAPLFTPEVLYWEGNILRWAADWDLDPNLVATVMQIESCGDFNAISSAGAIGLFQVMPYHFVDGENPFNPETNALRGMAYLQKALNTYNTIKLAFASYNGGISTAAKPENQWPEETIGYVYWGANIYKDAASGSAVSAVLDEWLNAGGVSLCSQAYSSLGLNP